MSEQWKPMRTVPKEKGKMVTLLGTTDAGDKEYYEIYGVYDKELDCFTTKVGWVIVAVAWK